MWSSGHVVIERTHRWVKPPASSGWVFFLATAILAAGWVMPAPASAQTRRNAVKVAAGKAKAQRKKAEPAVAETPPAPLLPYQLPARDPIVSFHNGQLGIVADNSTLAGVLKQVGVVTGAAVDFPASAGDERVSAQLGPGEPSDVMADLLNGSSYNYVLLGSSREPRGLERIIVTKRGAPATPPSAAPASVFPVRVQQTPEAEPEEESEIEPVIEETPEDAQPVPPEGQPGTPQLIPQPGAPGQSPNQTPGQPPQVKTPQELLQELQERLRRQPERNEQRRQEQEEEEPR